MTESQGPQEHPRGKLQEHLALNPNSQHKTSHVIVPLCGLHDHHIILTVINSANNVNKDEIITIIIITVIIIIIIIAIIVVGVVGVVIVVFCA